MKARIEKKLSRRLVQLAPTLFRKAWIDDSEPSDLAQQQRTAVNHVYSMGGGTDFAGDGQEHYTVWEWWHQHWSYNCGFAVHEPGHKHAGHPDTGALKPSTIGLLHLAVRAEAVTIAEVQRIEASRLKYTRKAEVA